MTSVNRNIHGLRDAMFDVLDLLRAGKITLSQARAQMETAKTICLTVACERQELEILQRQIELDERVSLMSNRRVIEHEAP